MIPLQTQIQQIVDQIVSKYSPTSIILFGSCAKGCITDKSDIDLCLIADYEDKKQFLLELLMNIESERDIDFVIYRPFEWERYKDDQTTFAHIIYSKGVVVYGGYIKA